MSLPLIVGTRHLECPRYHSDPTGNDITRQAVPFSNLYDRTNQESLHLLVKVANVSNKDTVLDVACGLGIVACAFAAEALGKLGSEAAIPRLLRAI